MVNKFQDMADKAAAAGLFDKELAATIKTSAQQIWLAGLGAFSKAQEEGGKVFDALVEEGAGLQKKTKAAAGEKFRDAAGRMSRAAGEVEAQAGQQWEKFEAAVEQRTTQAMSRLGVPTKADFDKLAARVDELAARLAKLAKAPSPRAGSTGAARQPGNGATKPARKSAGERAARKKV